LGFFDLIQYPKSPQKSNVSFIPKALNFTCPERSRWMLGVINLIQYRNSPKKSIISFIACPERLVVSGSVLSAIEGVEPS
jgi:hypothetical protein